MKHTSKVVGLALACALTACGPSASPTVHTVAQERPTGLLATVAPQALVAPAPAVVDAGGILGKMKEPVGLVRQSAFIRSLGDALPLTMVSGGLTNLAAVGTGVGGGSSIISEAGGSIISEAGGSLIGNNGGALRLLAVGQSPAPDMPVPIEREGLVYESVPSGIGTGTLSIFDAKGFNFKQGANNDAALIDRFNFTLVNSDFLPDGRVSFDMDMKIVSSKRLAFVDKLVVRQTGKMTPPNGFALDTLEYVLGFSAGQADGSNDRVELHLTGTGTDLVLAKDAKGQDIPGTAVPAHMSLTGSNGHGSFTGGARFPSGGAIQLDLTHARDDGSKTTGTLTLQPDGGQTVVTTSQAGQLQLTASRTPDGKVSLAVQDLAHGTPVPLPPEVASLADGIATFDFGEAQKGRARLY